jgi:hypothetical protein
MNVVYKVEQNAEEDVVKIVHNFYLENFSYRKHVKEAKSFYDT